MFYQLVTHVNHTSVLTRWVPYDMEFLRASNLSEAFIPDLVSFDADGRMPCNATEREVTIIDDDVAVLDDGRLIMFGQESRTTGGAGRLTFSGAEYCIDRVSLVDNITFPGSGGRRRDDARRDAATAAPVANTTAAAVLTYTYVALVCRPCSRITCVPKCCAKGFMLEYQKNKILGCRRSLSVANANAAIHLKAANGTQLTREYTLTQIRSCNMRHVHNMQCICTSVRVVPVRQLYTKRIGFVNYKHVYQLLVY